MGTQLNLAEYWDNFLKNANEWDQQIEILIVGLGLITILICLAYVWRRGGGQTDEEDERPDRTQYSTDEMMIAKQIKTKSLRALSGARNHTLVIELIHNLDPLVQDIFTAASGNIPNLISYKEAFQITESIRKCKPKRPIYLIIHTLGGLSIPSIMIADAIRQHEGLVTAFVPYIAMSGGTMVAMAAAQIWMGPTARLGPVDTTYYGVPGQALREISKRKPQKNLSDGVILEQIESEKYDRFSAQEFEKLTHKNHKDREKNFRRLSNGSLSHSHAIDKSYAKDMGLKIIEGRKGPSENILDQIYGFVDGTLGAFRVGQ